MKLWLVTLDPKQRSWDCSRGHVVRAPDESTARVLAGSEAGDEGSDVWQGPMATCEEITQEGESAVILTDFLSG